MYQEKISLLSRMLHFISTPLHNTSISTTPQTQDSKQVPTGETDVTKRDNPTRNTTKGGTTASTLLPQHEDEEETTKDSALKADGVLTWKADEMTKQFPQRVMRRDDQITDDNNDDEAEAKSTVPSPTSTTSKASTPTSLLPSSTTSPSSSVPTGSSQQNCPFYNADHQSLHYQTRFNLIVPMIITVTQITNINSIIKNRHNNSATFNSGTHNGTAALLFKPQAPTRQIGDETTPKQKQRREKHRQTVKRSVGDQRSRKREGDGMCHHSHCEEPLKLPLITSAAKKKSSDANSKKNKRNNKNKDTRTQGTAGLPWSQGDRGPPGKCTCKDVDSGPPMRPQAAMSAVWTTYFGPDKDVVIPFDLGLIGSVDNYDNVSRVFFCSIPGTYVISAYLMSHPGSKVNARVFVNSRPVAALWADDNKDGGFYPSSSIPNISRLEFGDQVYVMLVDGGYGESWVHVNYNVYTVFLLYEDFFAM